MKNTIGNKVTLLASDKLWSHSCGRCKGSVYYIYRTQYCWWRVFNGKIGSSINIDMIRTAALSCVRDMGCGALGWEGSAPDSVIYTGQVRVLNLLITETRAVQNPQAPTPWTYTRVYRIYHSPQPVSCTEVYFHDGPCIIVVNKEVTRQKAAHKRG